MTSSGLADVPPVEIDPSGRFKYVLAKVYTSENAGDDDFQYFVRGFQWGAFHADIFEKLEAQIAGLGLSCECVGGGRIVHQPDQRKLEVFGYSQGYGRADHAITAGLLRKKYPGYEVTTSDEGY
ncbi:LOW QUALITY PROTEIN: 14 kDa phosphohistidine phosphatase-like [Pollicipes pollicipes]|uniref:LOW QUALITY PROTEIN: 14 kDa phosphohistidine phosphatase-like n=1 Tax=Pollicipes pollicipes TaxID=41117 RepID=UPI0018850DC5|nr:LOW QUALITY PROTEIN: 14 kDa phosphohistidine phosphatase-like [Pollicipes pollicipes]